MGREILGFKRNVLRLEPPVGSLLHIGAPQCVCYSLCVYCLFAGRSLDILFHFEFFEFFPSVETCAAPQRTWRTESAVWSLPAVLQGDSSMRRRRGEKNNGELRIGKHREEATEKKRRTKWGRSHLQWQKKAEEERKRF